MAEPGAAPRPWGDHDLGPGEEQHVRIGPLRLHARRRGDEVWISHTRAEDGGNEGGSSDVPAVPNSGPVDDVDWERWAVPDRVDGLRLSPIFPDRPLVARPEHAFHLVRGTSVRIYVRVPLWVAVGLSDPEGVTLTEVPTHILSDTWFGDVMDGELMYFLPTTARRKIGAEHFAPHLAACPLRLSNESDDDLEVEKVALRLAHLSIFARDGELWADETRIRYRGSEVGSEIQMSGDPPAEARDAQLVTPPRVPETRGFRARTFARLANLPGFGTFS